MIVDLLVYNKDTYRVDINPSIRHLHPYKKLFMSDKGGIEPGDTDGRKKLYSMKVLAYIFHMTDLRSPIYRSNPTEARSQDRHEQAVERLELPSDFVPNDIVKECIEYYVKDISTTYDDLLESAIGSIFRLTDYFDTVNFSDPKFSFKNYSDAINNLRDMIRGIEKLKEDICKDTLNKSMIRGGGEAGAFED